MRTLSLIALLVLACLLGGMSTARARKGVVAPLNALGIDPAEARKVQRWVRAAFSGLPNHRWLSSSRLERMLKKPRYRDCETQPDCIAALGRKIGADIIVTGDVGSLSGAYMLYLRRVEQTGGKVHAVNAVLDPAKRGLRDAVRSLAYQLLLPDRFTGSIDVKADVDNAWIYLDGQRVARAPTKRLENIPVGTHALRVTHEAYRDYVRFVKVEFDRVSTVDVNLSAFPVSAGEMKLVNRSRTTPLTDKELPWYRRWWALTAFGAVVLAGSATAAVILSRGSVESDSEVTVRP